MSYSRPRKGVTNMSDTPQTGNLWFPEAPAKPLPVFSKLPLAASLMVAAIIKDDEGGWILETDPIDEDGGWTYGGMTAKLWRDYYPKTTWDDIHGWSIPSEERALFQQTIICIYYQEFYIPLLKGALAAETRIPSQMMVSAAVDCGVESARSFIQTGIAVTGKGSDGQKEAFLAAWKEHYFAILRNRPQDIKYIHGWINRVWKYIYAEW